MRSRTAVGVTLPSLDKNEKSRLLLTLVGSCAKRSKDALKRTTPFSFLWMKTYTIVLSLDLQSQGRRTHEQEEGRLRITRNVKKTR